LERDVVVLRAGGQGSVNFRRYYVPGATVFITRVVEGRHLVLGDERNLALLRSTLHRVKELHPFAMVAYVFLPDHFHLLITPAGDGNFTEIMHSLKPNYTKDYKQAMGMQGSLKLWQKRFWDHVIRDDDDIVPSSGLYPLQSSETWARVEARGVAPQLISGLEGERCVPASMGME
jgi:REP element-mobilizing transposase RayT